MKNDIESYLHDAPPVIDSDYRRLQQAALREFLRLSPAAVEPVVSQIEAEYQTAKSNAAAKYEEAKKRFDARLQAALQTAQDYFQQRRSALQATYDSQCQSLEDSTAAQRDQLSAKAEHRQQEAQKNCEYDLLMAENIAEGTLNKYQQERQSLKAAVPAARDQLQRIEDEARALLQSYQQQVLPPAESSPPSGATPDPKGTFRQQRQWAEECLVALRALTIPRLMAGALPWFLTFLLCGLAVGLARLAYRIDGVSLPAFYLTGSLVGAGVLVGLILVGQSLRRVARRQVQTLYIPLHQAILTAQASLDHELQRAVDQLDQKTQEAITLKDEEIRKARDHQQRILADTQEKIDAALKQLEDNYQQVRRQWDESFAHDRRVAELDYQKQQARVHDEYAQELGDAKLALRLEMAEAQGRYDLWRRQLADRWRQGLGSLQALREETAFLDNTLRADWHDDLWQQWTPPDTALPLIRFGTVALDLNLLAEHVIEQSAVALDRHQTATLPALLAFPNAASLFLQTPREGREQAIATLRSVMMRLFTALPPGRVRFTIFDPIGLGENFAGFMHAADYQDALVGGRIWTDANQIQQRLVDLTDHMENVIQKYLRNEFQTIEQYNRQAGPLAEPYRFLVIADFPVNFNEDAARRLHSIINSGPRCGVYTLIAYDNRLPLPPGLHLEDVTANGVHLRFDKDRFIWQDDILRAFPLTLDTPPADHLLTGIIQTVGKASIDASRIEVPFAVIAPTGNQYWSRDSAANLSIPIGRTGATRLQQLRLGQGVAQHALLAGKTGSGKSTLLHVIITNLALWYSPDQVELYLIDFKRGVEFKTYVTHRLPHARAVAIESDREFGLSILQRLNAEMAQRGELFRQAGVQDIAGYRQATGTVLPRTVLIVDEFQVFFAEDDKLAQDATILLEQLVRQGRAFGVHVLLGSQTLGGTSRLAQSTIGQMAIRIALQCAEADARQIFEDDNLAARLLSRPGEAIYNDAGGMVVGNSPFQTSWLPEEVRDGYLTHLSKLAADTASSRPPLIVFEGNAPADIADNHLLATCLSPSGHPVSSGIAYAWLGEPVAIKDPTAATFRRQGGASLLIVGQNDVAAMALMQTSLVSLVAQQNSASAQFYILDGSPTDADRAGPLADLADRLLMSPRLIDWRQVPVAMSELAEEVQKRHQNLQTQATSIYVFIHGLQRYRVLRRNDDDFSFSATNEAAARPDKQFTEVLRDGPAVGVHLLVWADTLTTLERTVDRRTLREFSQMVLFQMSAADSSTLIDSPLANQLGFHRAIFYSEEHGALERFRPYASPATAWLQNKIGLLKH